MSEGPRPDHPGSLAGRRAVVTGAGSPTGIGFASARQLGELGASVLVASTTDRIHDRVAQLRALGISADGFVGDLTDPATAAALIGGDAVDVLVNNAGLVTVSDSLDATDGTRLPDLEFDTWTAALRRNLDTAFLATRAALPGMIAAGWGRIVMVSSVTGPVMAMRADPAYAAAKAGLLGLVRALAVDHAADGITVNAVAPGWIATASQLPHEVTEGSATPIGRSGTAAEVASAIAWLASTGASYITGQCLVIDGGNSVAEERHGRSSHRRASDETAG